MKRIAEDPQYFSFLTRCKANGANYEIILGDARVQLERNHTERYGMIFVDAFSSDSIPVHLLTREAVKLYFERLESDGVLILHISNRYLNLRPVVAKLAEDAQLTAWLCVDGEDKYLNKAGSNWVVLARRTKDLGRLPLQVAPVNSREDDFDELELQPPDRQLPLGLVGGGMPPLTVHYHWKEMKAKADCAALDRRLLESAQDHDLGLSGARRCAVGRSSPALFLGVRWPIR